MTAPTSEESLRFHNHLQTVQLNIPMLTQRYIRVHDIATMREDEEQLKDLEEVDRYLYRCIRDMKTVSQDVALGMTNDVMRKDWQLVGGCRWKCHVANFELWDIEEKLDGVYEGDKKEEVE
jgi:hypothetical protein